MNKTQTDFQEYYVHILYTEILRQYVGGMRHLYNHSPLTVIINYCFSAATMVARNRLNVTFICTLAGVPGVAWDDKWRNRIAILCIT
jgi:hypothetical protein